jgi:PTS system glucitol/sorbitol-specific IIA component
MSLIWKTEITDVGPEVADLAEGGVVIFFASGAPPELAEVSVLHRQSLIGAEDPRPGARIQIGGIEAKITAIGDKAWDKVREIGHVVVNFNGASAADRPGEICAEEVDGAALVAALVAGSEIAISA